MRSSSASTSFPEHELAYVFEAFFRIAGPAGGGLPLSIARDAVARLSGAVILTNLLDAGHTGLRPEYTQTLAA